MRHRLFMFSPSNPRIIIELRQAKAHENRMPVHGQINDINNELKLVNCT